MGDHYLPRHYLNGFAVKERFWVHDLELRQSRLGQPKSEANVNGLWPGELERHLADKIEGPAQASIDRIRQFQPIASEEREPLATYLLTMWKRVPAAKDRTAAHIPKLAVEHKKAYLAQIDEYSAAGSISEEEADGVKQRVSDILDRIVKGPPDFYWHHGLREGASPRMMSALLTMEWTFLVSNTDPFLTCDDPLFFFKELGIGRASSELSIPLSSSITLLAHRQGTTPGQFRDARASTVVQLNRRTAYNARRFMYSEQALPWALKLGGRKPRPQSIRL